MVEWLNGEFGRVVYILIAARVSSPQGGEGKETKAHIIVM